MDRRDFLKGAAAGIAGTTVAGAGCATRGAVAPPPASSVAEMEAFLARFDRGLEAIDRGAPLPGVFRGDVGAGLPHARERAALFRRTLRTLYAVGSFGELGPADQLHPGMQDRMWRLLPEIDEVMEAHQRLLAGLGPSDHERLQAHLRADPGLPIRLAEALDDAAAAEGLGPSRRGRLRVAATEVGTRLRTQPPALLVGEYLDKARRVQEREGALGSTERALVARTGEAAFWEYRDWAERESLAWRERLAAGSGGGEPPRALAARTLRTGAKLLGIGILVGGASALFVSAGVGVGLVGVTVGVILIVIGLLALPLAGLQWLGEWNERAIKAEEERQLRGAARPVAEPALPEPPAPPPSPPASPDPAAR